MALSRSELLKAVTKLKTIDVEGIGQVLIKPLPVSDILQVDANDNEASFKIIAKSLCDEDGQPLFSLEDLKNTFPMWALVKLTEVVFKELNLTQEADKKLVGESNQTTSTDSVSS